MSNTIAGSVGVSGVVVSWTGTASGSATSGAAGTYVTSALGAGTYTLIPLLAGYTFTPAFLTETIVSSNLTGKDFVALRNNLGALPTGVIVQLSNGATLTGTAASFYFTVEAKPDGNERTLALACQGTAVAPTTATVAIEASFDGGTTWQTYASSIALVAGGVATTSPQTHIVAGPIYRVDITALTLGSASSVTIYGVVN